jgi:S-formylglutathione hydrolase FrmB
MVAGLAAAILCAAPPTANSTPEPGTPVVESVTMLTPQKAAMIVRSPALARPVQVQVLLPAHTDRPRPTLYLLDGAGAGEESNYRESAWTQKTDAAAFFADKNVNVVLPVGGTGTFYTNWLRPDPTLGGGQWETFLTRELPPLIDARFSGNGVNAIAGVSMGAHAALTLTARNRNLYRAVAAFSGCPDNTEPVSQLSVRATVAWKGGDADNMWGPESDPAWAGHDPLLLADALRGKTIYVSAGTGAVGPLDDPTTVDGLSAMTLGGQLEAAAWQCTKRFEQRLDELAIPATFHLRSSGTHSWPYWQQDLRDAWPHLSAALEP